MKKEKWLKFRHKFTRKVIFPLAWVYTKIKSGAKRVKFDKKKKGPFVVIFNHQTAYDQFIVSMSFKYPLTYVASDDLFSNGVYSKIISYFGSLIPIKKNVTDMTAVKNCIKAVRGGSSVALSPEGNRTFSGETGYFNPAIAPLVKKLGVPLLIYRIEGGYGCVPRWCDKPRRGNLIGYVKREVSTEEIEKLSKEQLVDLIKNELYFNDFEVKGKYACGKNAEYLERVAYVCPKCGLAEFESKGNNIKCVKCGLEITYNDDRSLTCKDSAFTFNNYLEWYKYQEAFINKLNLLDEKDKLFYEDNAFMYKAAPGTKRKLIDKNAKISLYGGKITVEYSGEKKEFLFEKTLGVSVLGRNKLNVYFDHSVYQFKGSKRFNAVKYLNFYHKYKNQFKGEENGFLGL